MKNKMKTITSNKNLKYKIQDLKKAIEKKNISILRKITKSMNPTDVANAMEKIELKEKIFLLRSLDNLTASEVFNEFSAEATTKIINEFTKKETKEIISPLYSDDLVELIEEMPGNIIFKILESATKEQRKDINYILNYKEGMVGYEMHVNFMQIKINEKVSEIIQKIKKPQTKIDEEAENYFYVVDEKGVLIGYVSWKKLLQENPSKLIEEIFETDVISIRAFDNKEKAMQKIVKYQLAQLPVVNKKNKLVGVLTGEDTVQLLKEEFSDDINKQAGIVEDSDKKYFEISIWKTFKSRIPWLLITILITTFSQFIFSILLKDFDDNSLKMQWFKFVFPFIPFILTIVGNIALQSNSIVVKGLTLQEITNSKIVKVLKKELAVAFWIGFAVLIINIPRTFLIELVVQQEFNFFEEIKFWKNLGNVSIIIVSAIILTILFSSVLPILANKWGYDPALMSSPLLTTIVDLLVTGIAVGFSYLLYVLI